MSYDSIPIPGGAELIGRTEDDALVGFPAISDVAFHGLAGEFARFAAKSSEASPAAILFTTLTAFSAMLGRSCYVVTGASVHHARLFSMIVGSSSRSRKGSSAEAVLRLMEAAEAEGAGLIDPLRVVTGSLSSGEALVSLIRDASEAVDKSGSPTDTGTLDKRVFLLDSELGGMLKRAKLEGNSISPMLRNAWDGSTLSPLTKRDKIKATKPHVALVGHVTVDELKASLQGSTSIHDGFLNRFLVCAARRERVTPLPKPLDVVELHKYARQVVTAVQTAQHHNGAVHFTEKGRKRWQQFYVEIAQRPPSRIDDIIARSEAQLLRVALLFTLLKDHKEIGVAELEAAKAVIDYSTASATFIFARGATRVETERCRRIIERLKVGPAKQSDLIRLFSGNLSATQVHELLFALEEAGVARCETLRSGAGRPALMWHLLANLEDCIF